VDGRRTSVVVLRTATTGCPVRSKAAPVEGLRGSDGEVASVGIRGTVAGLRTLCTVNKRTHTDTYLFTGDGPSVTGGHRYLPCAFVRRDVFLVDVCSGVRRATLAFHDVSVSPLRALFVFISKHGRYVGTRFSQLDDDCKMWAVYCRAQII